MDEHYMEQQVIYVEVYSIQHYVIKFVSDNKPNHNTTKYVLLMTTSTNPIIIRACVVFTDGRQQ
jgi:hypothetical protein